MQKKILFVNACVRKESRTRKLAEEVLSTLNGEITELKLFEEPLRPLNEETLLWRSKAASEGDFSDERFFYAKQLAQADLVVIAAPYWDFSFPALLKIWIENISVSGLTFRYTEDGRPHGLCKADKLIYVTTAGGWIGNNDFGYEYVSALVRELYGIWDSQRIVREGLDF